MSDAWDDETPVKLTVNTKKWAGEDAEVTKPKVKEIVKSEEAKKREKELQDELKLKAEQAAYRQKYAFVNPGAKSMKSKVDSHAEKVAKENKRKALLAERLIAHNCKTEEQLNNRIRNFPKAIEKEWADYLKTKSTKS